MVDPTIELIQNEVRNVLLSMIQHNTFDTSIMTEDGLWLVDSGMLHLGKYDVEEYLLHNAIDTNIDNPEFHFTKSEFLGRECVSVIGDVEYHSHSEEPMLIAVNIIATWICEQREWKLKQLVTSSRRLDESERFLYGKSRIDTKMLLESIPVGTVCCYLEDRLPVQMISNAGLDLLEYQSISDYKHCVGNSFLPSIYPEDMDQFLDFVESLKTDSPKESIITRLRKKDFSYIWVQLFGSIRDNWLILSSVDYSENQTRAEHLKRESQRLVDLQDSYRILLDNIPTGFHRCALHEPVHLDYVSDTFCSMTGYSRTDIEETMHSMYVEMVVPEDHHIILETMKSLMSYPHVETAIYRMKKKDGSTIRVLDKMRSVRHPDGKLWGYSVVMEIDDHPVQKIEENSGATVNLPVTEQGHTVEIHTFGYFEVLIDGKPIAFRYGKARELLALLVDRKGNFVTRETIITTLWENETVNKTTLSRCRKTYMNLVNELKEYDIDDIVETVNNQRRINPEKVSCDLFDYQNGIQSAISAFRGEYLNEYSWAEITLSTLLAVRDF